MSLGMRAGSRGGDASDMLCQRARLVLFRRTLEDERPTALHFYSWVKTV